MATDIRIQLPTGVEVFGGLKSGYERVLTADSLAFVAALHRRFNATRKSLLQRRVERQATLDAGVLPTFLDETRSVREDTAWRVAPIPADLQDRRVEITGPVERKMMINALNSGAQVFMADLEDSLSPTWDNVIQGQINLMDAHRGTIEFVNPDGRRYVLNEQIAKILVRPRGWHLEDKHIQVDGERISASLLDFGLYVYHNARQRIEAGSAAYFYLPKMESHLEARLWNDVFNAAQDELGISRGTLRATVLIETILAAFEMDEILYELRAHILGLNAGRWDYIFSIIKKYRNQPGFALPDRGQVTMTVPFMRAYALLLVQTCHKRGAHAIGGMAAFIPSRKDPAINEVALAKVREDKEREANDGFDGTWVAHPDLVTIAKTCFDSVLGDKPHQKNRLREDVSVSAAQIADFVVPGGKISEAGIRLNVSVAIQYLTAWLGGNGAAAIFNLMEDAATAEISRAQLWQWLHTQAPVEGLGTLTQERYKQIRDEELAKLGDDSQGLLARSAALLDTFVLANEFEDFLTLRAYEQLD
jgi:malate synthase